MGTVPHHLSRAREFLQRADRAITADDPSEAAVALCRSASHTVTALAVHQGYLHNSRRRLEMVLQGNIAAENLSRSHLKTFRQLHILPAFDDHTVPAFLDAPPRPAHGEPVEPRAQRRSAAIRSVSAHTVTNLPHPSRERAGASGRPHTQLRRMRRRVASLVTDANALIDGAPNPVVHHKRWLRKPDLPAPPDFTSVQDILTLPDFLDIRLKFKLHGVPLAADPDPHGFYARGQTPRRCQCHAELWNKPGDPHRITLSPLWRRALEKTFNIRLPDPLRLAC